MGFRVQSLGSAGPWVYSEYCVCVFLLGMRIGFRLAFSGLIASREWRNGQEHGSYNFKFTALILVPRFKEHGSAFRFRCFPALPSLLTASKF